MTVLVQQSTEHAPATDAIPADVPAMTLRVRTVQAAGGTVVTVSGAISDHDAALLSRCLHAQLELEPALLVVDLSRVPSCDHTGRHVLGLARERAAASGTELRLADLGHPVAREWLTDAGLA
jgi:anti-anti-sigma regulatory factor